MMITFSRPIVPSELDKASADILVHFIEQNYQTRDDSLPGDEGEGTMYIDPQEKNITFPVTFRDDSSYAVGMTADYQILADGNVILTNVVIE